MSNFGYVPLDDDLIEDLGAAAITVYDEDANYPEANMQTQAMAECSRATDPGAGIKINLDFGGNVNPKFWAILNHNIASGNPVVKSFSDAFITLTGETLAMVYRALDTKAYKSAGWTPARYFQVDLSACTFNDAFFEWGKLIATLDITILSANYSPGISRGISYESIHNRTEFGVVWTYKKRGPVQEMGIRFDAQVISQIRSELETLWNTIDGGAYPILILPDNSGLSDFYYMRSEDDRMSWVEIYDRALLQGLNLRFTEESRGAIQAT